MAKVKVILEIDIELLQNARREAGIEELEEESLIFAIEQELGWVGASGISVREIQEMTAESEICDLLGQYLSTEVEHFPKVISALTKALKNAPDAMVDDVVFDIGNDEEREEETISMWEPLEYKYTVEKFCELVGIK
jgi:hypothetical protein